LGLLIGCAAAATATVSAAGRIPKAPSNLRATAAGTSQINLAWTDNSTNEIGFRIQRSLDGVHFTEIRVVGVNVTTYADTGLTAATRYYYRVRAYNGSGASAFSNTANATTASTGGGGGPYGSGVSLNGYQVFPPDNPWNQDISTAPVDPNSANLIASIGSSTGLHPDFGTVWNGAPNGIPYVVVPGTQPRVPILFTLYGSQSDPGPYPVPPDAPIEGGPSATGDRHVLVVDRDNGWLYEMYYAFPQPDGSWQAGSGAVFDLKSNALRPAGWTSADAAGLPIFPGLVRYDEVVERGVIPHALRFTASPTRMGYVYPARHAAGASTDPNLPPMGMRVRLKASFNISTYPASARVILTALKKYGMFLADNGSDWFISGAPDPRWNDTDLHAISSVTGQNFEVVQMGTVTPQ
jgi:hypothetical protein